MKYWMKVLVVILFFAKLPPIYKIEKADWEKFHNATIYQTEMVPYEKIDAFITKLIKFHYN